MNIIEIVHGQRASPEVRAYALHLFNFQHYTVAQLTQLFSKSDTTIRAWIKQYNDLGTLTPKERETHYRRVGLDRREWIVELYLREPTTYIHEAKRKFELHFRSLISKTTIWTILHDNNLTYKTLERRATNMCMDDINRFTLEMLAIPWIISNLVFIDESGFDNRDGLRKKGFGIKRKALVYRGEFTRSAGGVTGLLETVMTDGTFTRLKYVAALKAFAEENVRVRQYPGQNSLWIMDGASIHCDPNIVHYLRSMGIYVIFLPKYCAFYNPIELLFGMVKKKMKADYREVSTKDIKLFVLQTLKKFENHDFSPQFRKCGYSYASFDQKHAFKTDTIYD